MVLKDFKISQRWRLYVQKTWYYILIFFFKVLLAPFSMLRSYGLHFEYGKTLTPICANFHSTASAVVCFRL